MENEDENVNMVSGKNDSLALIFLFNSLPPIHGETLTNELNALGEATLSCQISDFITEENTLHAVVTLNHPYNQQHRFRLVGFDLPAPDDAVGDAIECAHWRQEDKEPLRNHKAHLICYYQGDSESPTEQLIATLQMAGAFIGTGLIGVVDIDSWNCLPTPVLVEMLSPSMLESCRTTVPMGLWTGFVKMFLTDEDIWFCSKGFHRWGVTDFAYLGKHEEAEDIFKLFGALFNHAVETNTTFQAGHTAQMDEDILLRFEPVEEYHDYLVGPAGTLVVKRIVRSQMH